MTEQHPLEPFLPQTAKILMLGSFPPPRNRWCMDFFYPNYINDMWRIMGIIFFDNKDYFCITSEKRFDKEKIIDFCNNQGIAIFDTATKVVRQKENASDKFLDIVERTDINAILNKIPDCHTIVTTGEKASQTLSEILDCEMPKVGAYIEIYKPKDLRFYRMPSSSRAYPMKIEKKAEFYEVLMKNIM